MTTCGTTPVQAYFGQMTAQTSKISARTLGCDTRELRRRTKVKSQHTAWKGPLPAFVRRTLSVTKRNRCKPRCAAVCCFATRGADLHCWWGARARRAVGKPRDRRRSIDRRNQTPRRRHPNTPASFLQIMSQRPDVPETRAPGPEPVTPWKRTRNHGRAAASRTAGFANGHVVDTRSQQQMIANRLEQ